MGANAAAISLWSPLVAGDLYQQTFKHRTVKAVAVTTEFAVDLGASLLLDEFLQVVFTQ